MAAGGTPRRLKLEGLPAGMTVVRQLGSSPLSEVFLVADDDGRLSALKVLRISAKSDPRIRERWRREAQLLEELSHPNLIRSYGALEVQGRPALQLEFIEGASLRDRLADGPLAWEAATRIGIQVARALQLLHRHGALHRDVKPHNILMDARRGAVLTDLGLVRRREDPTLTSPGAALGSPAYMSPEQARDPSDVGPEADVYSLGATLHHALSGVPPFLGQGVGEVIHRVLHTEPEPLPDSVPLPLKEVLALAMAKDPEERYGQARDLANDLGRVLLGNPPLMVSRRRRRARLKSLGLAAATIAVVAAGSWAILGGGSAVPEDDDLAVVAQPERIGAADPVPAAPRPETRAADGDLAQARVSRDQFQRWATQYETAYSGYLAAGRLREALNEIDLLAGAEMPAFADDHFRHLRAVLVREARQSIFATAEQATVDAERILEGLRDPALQAIEREDFDGQAWMREVQAGWQAARLPVSDLPLRPGGSNPRQRLELARAALEKQQDRRITERAEAEVVRLRGITAEKLRQGRFSESKSDWQLWKDRKPEYYMRSPMARREKTRVDQLARLEEKFYERLDNLRDTEVRLSLRPARLTGRLVVPLTKGDPYRLDLGGREVPIEFLDMDPEHLAGFLLRDPAVKEFQWTLAHLYWSQGQVDRALALMRDELAFREFAPEMETDFWEEEWERELALAAEGAGPRRALGGAETAPGRGARLLTPADRLAGDWARILPGAKVEAVDGGVEITWENPDWSERWNEDLRFPRRRWFMEAWRIEWQLPVGGEPPRRWTWADGVVWERPIGTALPFLRVADRQVEGLDMVPGASQALEWRDGRVYFDDLDVGSLSADDDSRLRLEASADPAFRPARVWLRVAPRN